MVKDPCVSVKCIRWSPDGSIFGKLIDNGTLVPTSDSDLNFLC